MISCEHFVYGMFNGVGYRTIKSPDLDQVLSRKSLDYLRKLKGNSPIQTMLPDGLVAITFLDNNGHDEYGRKTVWNHTILIAWSDYFSLNPPLQFYGHFISELPKQQSSLKPLEIKT